MVYRRRQPNAVDWLLIASLLFVAPICLAAEVEHDLDVRLDPVSGELSASDRITLPERLLANTGSGLEFLLHAALQPSLLDENGGAIELEPTISGDAVSHYRVRLLPQARSLTIRYHGNLAGSEMMGGVPAVSLHGVQLSGNAAWYPIFGDEQVRFRLRVHLPADWTAVSQGARISRERNGESDETVWREPQPQPQIWLLANRYHEYRRRFPEAEALAFLLQPDEPLAHRYLVATGEYLQLYTKLIGPYPYAKFALVENPHQTGYGMPSFTLLGSRVLRLPFLLQSSYPHEILHNWWGNGVYVDYGAGNWSEGLTAYLADHLLAEREGRGADYRRAALQKYADYVDAGEDFPLREFRSRHSDATMAIGYNKSLMFFHDLRRRLGDELFFASLRSFYDKQKFRTASWNSMRHSFEKSSGRQLQALYTQALERTGAPLLSVSDVRLQRDAQGYRLTGVLLQEQEDAPFEILVLLQVMLASGEAPVEAQVEMKRKRQGFDLALPSRPLRLDVDPAYDLFRRLHPAELPPSLGQLFGSRKITAVLPAAAPAELHDGMAEMVRVWQQRYPQIGLALDSELQELPEEGGVWILGWDNKFLPVVKESAESRGGILNRHGVSVHGSNYARDEYSTVLAVRRLQRRGFQPVAWLGCHDARALPGLSRKLTHYGRYGYLAFFGEEPKNVAKGEWPRDASPLTVDLAEYDLTTVE